MEDLTHWVMERVAKMPREHRFTVGGRLLETCLEVTLLLCLAAAEGVVERREVDVGQDLV
jgi:hypothetical protein